MPTHGLLKYLLLSCLLFQPFSAQAQDDNQPFLEFEMEETDTIPGQPLTMRLTVMVPTFMPQPVEFPAFDLPNLRIVLPADRATLPTSRRINGRNWAGVTRRIFVIPLVAGRFGIPPQDVGLTYSSPDDNSPISMTLQTPTIEFSAPVPEAAAQLDPFIAAGQLSIDQTFEGDPGNLSPGDSLRWTVTATVQGNSPMVIPTLLPDLDIPGIRAYPDEPQLQESFQDNQLSGSRRESIVLMAESATSANIPAISLQWYNPDTDTIETATTENFRISVTGSGAVLQDRNWPSRWPLILEVVLVLLLLAAAWHWLRAPLKNSLQALLTQYRNSEPVAFRKLLKAVNSKSLPDTLDALALWQTRWQGPAPRSNPDIAMLLNRLGQSVYGTAEQKDVVAYWPALHKALVALRRYSRQHAMKKDALPPLNPS